MNEWPAELLTLAELRTLTGRQQPAAIRRWLDAAGVRYVATPSGVPLVYRRGLLPGSEVVEDAALNLDGL